MRPGFMKDAGGRTGALVRLALAATAAAALSMSAGAARAGPSSTNNLVGANIYGGVVVVTETTTTTIDLGNGAYLGLGRGGVPSRDAAGMSLRPSGQLVATGGGNPHLKAAFSATFTLSGRPNQAFGLSVPGATLLQTGGADHSTRAFTHDAGQTPALGHRGNAQFNVGATFSLDDDKRQNHTYIWAIDIIVSNN